MTLEQLFDEQQAVLLRGLSRMLGGREPAEDVLQDVLLRAWLSLPRDIDRDGQRAWLHRSARNAAIDELRRRRRWGFVELNEADAPAHDGRLDGDGPAAAALETLTVHERFLLRLRTDLGLTHHEVGQVLGVSAEVARKRFERARTRLGAAHRRLAGGTPPRVLVLLGDDEPEPYERWLRAAGAEPRITDAARFERDLPEADGVVVTGSPTDIHPALYGEPIRARLEGALDLRRDRADLAAVALSVRDNVPFVGVCRGHQLLNVASGGSLVQDLGVAVRAHAGPHPVETLRGSSSRGLLGRAPTVSSEHHQSVARLGRSLRVGSASRDGVIESVERTDRGFALGVQWHPELPDEDETSERLGAALVEAALARRAA